MSKEVLINVERLSRFYAERCAVEAISFMVNRGEVLGFLGPNGAGKSTTMQIIAGVLTPSAGTVSIAGYDIIEQPGSAKQQLGFLPESPPLYLDATVDEYLRYCAQLHRVAKTKITDVVANCKQRCGLQASGKRLIGNLSKGFQQRVGIAQAIVHSPAVLILDEPTSGLDPSQIVEIRQLISELRDEHSIIVSTHILSEVQSNCDRVLIINEGRLVLDEQLATLYKNEDYRSMTVALEKPPLLEELETVAGVEKVSSVDKHRFRVTFDSEINTPVLLSEKAAASGWGLFEMVPEADTLEEIYLQVTHGDPHLNIEENVI